MGYSYTIITSRNQLKLHNIRLFLNDELCMNEQFLLLCPHCPWPPGPPCWWFCNKDMFVFIYIMYAYQDVAIYINNHILMSISFYICSTPTRRISTIFHSINIYLNRELYQSRKYEIISGAEQVCEACVIFSTLIHYLRTRSPLILNPDQYLAPR